MRPFTTVTAVAAPLLRANIDTDAIIPSREMTSVSKSGLADGLFAGWRYRVIGGRDPDPDFILNAPEYADARILLCGENFGCGSSREHAAWALAEYGIRAIAAPSFNPIFRGNCIRNGILPLTLTREALATIAADIAADPQSRRVSIDLPAQRLMSPGTDHVFLIEDEAKQMLLHGLDAIDLTRQQQALIDTFIENDVIKRRWVYGR